MRFAWLDRLAALASIGAGLYLLQLSSVGADSNWLESIAHAMGVYFIAKGVFIGRSIHAQWKQNELLAKLVELNAHEHVRADETPAATAAPESV